MADEVTLASGSDAPAHSDRLVQDFLAHARDLDPLVERFGEPALFVAVGVEGFGIPAPGQTVLIAAVILAAQGKLAAPTVFAVAWTASVLGNLIGYAIGRFAGRSLIDRFGSGTPQLGRVEAIVRRYGAWLVVASRFVDGFRQLTGIAAGALRMPWWRYLGATLAGSTLWVGAVGGGVYLLDHHFYAIAARIHDLRHLGWIAAGIALGSLLLWLWIGKRRHS